MISAHDLIFSVLYMLALQAYQLYTASLNLAHLS